MRLLHTTSLELKEFHGAAVPPYAILSHTWVEGKEASFADFSSSADLNLNARPPLPTVPRIGEKSGLRKIRGACAVARRDGYNWIWIDTNCIDKASSAELTEAINSMYNWYRASAVCYAYLADVPDQGHLNWKKRKRDENGIGKTKREKGRGVVNGENGTNGMNGRGEFEYLTYFRRSRWFRRGWTLQELIAPRRVVFFSEAWTEIGDRSGLADEISAATGIEAAFLLRGPGDADLREVSVAKKMSWAARRATTRVEDLAYCLLGLFDVNMPLLYGEGAKAFVRLQQEIIRTTNDHTVFCWSRNGSVPAGWSSMLAPLPAAFEDAGDYVPVDAWDAPMPYSMTNLGLSIYLPVVYTLTQMFVVLDAGLLREDPDMRACIALQRTNQRRSGSNIFDRSRSFDSPTILCKEATDTRERYSLFIRCSLSIEQLGRLSPQSGSPYPSSAPFYKHGVLLFVDRTASRLLSTGKRDAPLGSVGYDIETHPAGIFDEATSLLRLPAFEGGSTLLTSGLLRICFKSPQETDFYLFFAVVATMGGREVWRCGAHSAADFAFVSRIVQENTDAGGEIVSEDELIHSYLRNEAWQSRGKQLTAATEDESLFVSLGGTMDLRPGTDVRAALLSGKSESPYSVPICATDLSGIVDETDDSDYVASEDEEIEDWDSSNEEEEEGESDAVDTQDSRGVLSWEMGSSLENSQALSAVS